MRLRLVFAALLIAAGCSPSNPPHAARPAALAAETLVVWISIDGFRHDYLDRADAPFLKSLRDLGAYSTQLTPTYPSLTFAVHSSEVTGASTGGHGIPGNTFWDRKLGEELIYPPRPELLKAEPIWVTATKAGRRVAVMDWPFSQRQVGNYASAYFSTGYNSQMSDDQRLTRLIDLMRYDDGGLAKKPLSLVIGYVEAVDKAGHKMGPLSNSPIEQLNRLDPLLEAVHAEAVKMLKEKFPAGSSLYFVISTDHGMTPVTHVVSLKAMLGDTLPAESHLIMGGGSGHVFLPESQNKPAQVAAILAQLQQYDFARTYTLATLKPQWRMLDADRIGDVYIDLKPGYTFTNKAKLPVIALADEPTTRPGDQSPRGMHSYDPAESSDMLGTLLIEHYREGYCSDGFARRNLGPVDARQLAPTVAAWLNIPPPPQAEVSKIPGLTP